MKGQYLKNIVKVTKMKKSKKNDKLLIALAKAVTKSELNSTSSPWTFQLKVPKNSELLKKK